VRRPIILHYHIFKNAGTTIDLILENIFGENAKRIDAKKPRDLVPNRAVLQYVANNHSINSVSSHQLRFPAPEDSNFSFLPMVFIRHPIDRIFSIYSYNKKRNDEIRLVKEAKEKSASEYILWNLNSEKSRDMKNFQVQFITNPINKVEQSPNDLEIAKKLLHELFLCGVVDRLDESLVLAEESLRPFFNEIDFSYIRRNVSTDRPENLQERIKEAHRTVGDDLMNRLKEENSQDLHLYEFSKSLLDERINEIEGFDEKMEDFKSRCGKLINEEASSTWKYKNRRIWYSEERSMLYHENISKGIDEDILPVS
jgi:hypothetical protein